MNLKLLSIDPYFFSTVIPRLLDWSLSDTNPCVPRFLFPWVLRLILARLDDITSTF